MTTTNAPDLAPLPKVDLHLHAEAGPRLDRLLAPVRGKAPFDWQSWSAWVTESLPPGMARLSDMARPLISPDDDAPPENFLARVTDALNDAAEAGAIYAEVRFGRETILRRDFMDLFRAAEDAVRRRFPTFFAEPLATLMPQRDAARTSVLADACLGMAREGLAGVDLIPDPYDAEAEWDGAYRLAELLATAGLPITVHAGEFSPANLTAAMKVPGVKRIGHGIHAVSDPEQIEELAKGAVALEVCITSNVILGGVPSYQEHPVARLAAAGVPITLNTDTPVRLGTDIAREYAHGLRCGLSLDELTKASATAIDFAFTTPERREQLRRLLAPHISGAGASSS